MLRQGTSENGEVGGGGGEEGHWGASQDDSAELRACQAIAQKHLPSPG